MPRIKVGSTLEQTMTRRIRAGTVVPILSNTVCNDLVLGQGQHTKLVAAFAKYVEYQPDYLAGSLKLPHVTQYVSIAREEQVADPTAAKELYLEFTKSWLFDLAEAEGRDEDTLAEIEDQFDELNFTNLTERLGFTRFDQAADDPLLVLANFPLPIYLTTSHHYYIEMALRRAGKQPRTAICPWREGLEERPFYFDERGDLVFEESFGQPSKEQPLVYHLHGFDQYPVSLVLTEDDYLDFLVAIARDKGRNTDLIPKPVRAALATSSLLLLGYHLRSWDFRALFWGLINIDKNQGGDHTNVSVQLEPDEVDENYLQSYLRRAKFDTYRGTIYDYVAELRQGREG